MRCQSFLEKNGWDYEKTCNTPVIKSALSHAESLFEFDEPPKKTEIKNSEKNAIIVTSNGETVIPINNILFATSSPFNVEETELDGCYEI